MWNMFMSSSIFFYVYIWALFISSSICSMLYMNIIYAIKNLFYVCINTVYVTKHLFYVYIWTLLISSVFFLFIRFTYELCLSHQGFVLCLYMNIIYVIKHLFYVYIWILFMKSRICLAASPCRYRNTVKLHIVHDTVSYTTDPASHTFFF